MDPTYISITGIVALSSCAGLIHSYFTLNTAGTSLLVSGRLDVDNGQLEYVILEIMVEDTASPALRDKAILNITLNEINDNAAILQGVPGGGYIGSVYGKS